MVQQSKIEDKVTSVKILQTMLITGVNTGADDVFGDNTLAAVWVILESSRCYGRLSTPE